MTKTVAFSDYPPPIDGDGILSGDDRSLRNEAEGYEAPDRDQELARQSDDRDPTGSSLERANALPEPCRQTAVRLVRSQSQASWTRVLRARLLPARLMRRSRSMPPV